MKPTVFRGMSFAIGIFSVLFSLSVVAQVDSRDVLVGPKLAAGFDMGVNSSEGRTDWLYSDVEHGYFQMSYPSGQTWGAVFITVGKPKQPPRPFRDLSAYQTLSIEMKSGSGARTVDVGIKTNTQPDDGSEAKITLNVTPEWKTYEILLNGFAGADLRMLYVVAEFVFADSNSQMLYVRNVKYLARHAKTN